MCGRRGSEVNRVKVKVIWRKKKKRVVENVSPKKTKLPRVGDLPNASRYREGTQVYDHVAE